MKSDDQELEGVEGDGISHIDDGSWTPSEFVHEPPVLTITQPKGSFCQIHGKLSVPLPPDDVYNIITDPNNRRVFKNIKEVVYRKVLQDDGNTQLVEVEQLGRWRFLVFSGTFSSRVLVEQNRQEHKMLFDLVKQGMMKKFSGSWKIEPLNSSQTSSDISFSRPQDGSLSESGSMVTFNQVVEPSVIPPWPLSNYIRSVSGKITREILSDLQTECFRLSHLKKPAQPDSQEVANP